MNHSKEMREAIKMAYDSADDKKKQISILAKIYQLSEEEIKKIAEPKEETNINVPELVKEILIKELDSRDREIAEKEEELKRLNQEYIIISKFIKGEALKV